VHPSAQDILDILNEAGLHRIRTPHHVHLACASSLSERTIRQWSAWRMGQALVAHSESGCSFWPALYIPSLVFQTSNKLKHRSVG